MSLIAHKFGGSSLADADRVSAVVELMRARKEARQIIVVSAMQGVTNALLALCAGAAAGAPEVAEQLRALERRHIEAARTLLGDAAAPVLAQLAQDFVELSELLKALSLLQDAPSGASALISGLGEVWSARLLSAVFAARGEPAEFLDAREVLRVTHSELGVQVLWEESQARLDAWLAGRTPKRIVVTGYVARDAAGRISTLGRNGSDYSASIFGVLFGAEEIHIWTDVDGVLSADPRFVPEAQVLGHLSYQEAFELAYFGAKVIHPQTMAPATSKGLPLFIRNTFNPAHPGTRIDANLSRDPPIKGITTIGGQALVTIEGAGMIGVPGTAERVFSALKAGAVSVVMISQGSSEHSICCVVQAVQAQRAQRLLSDAFSRELGAGAIQSVQAQADIAVLAVVGDGMAGQPGVAARLFAALARARINVRAIAQGSSERNISVAINEVDATRALRAVHAGFYLSAQTLSVGLIGPGQVGRALLRQLHAAAVRLKETTNLELRVRALAGRSKMVFSELGFQGQEWEKQYQNANTALQLDAFAAHVQAEHLPHALILDCSASSGVAEHYAEWLKRGIHVVTPNKQAGSGASSRYAAIKAATSSGQARFRYEATVGAGLPVISTLRDLLDTGDTVLSIEGMFSGTLAYLFNRYDGSTAFSALVHEAKALGYTEPDPRDDLSGLDVARKLVILGRELGMSVELPQVQVESLVPGPLQGASVEEFLARLPEFDAPMLARYQAAKSQGMVLRYVAKLNPPDQLSVALLSVPETHAFAHIRLTDNIVQFQTARYRDNPLLVQGPGAGPEVTAAGVFADLLRIASSLGAKL